MTRHVLFEGVDMEPNRYDGERHTYEIFQTPSIPGLKISFDGTSAAFVEGGQGYKNVKSAKSAFRRHNWPGVKWTKVNEPLSKWEMFRMREQRS